MKIISLILQTLLLILPISLTVQARPFSLKEGQAHIEKVNADQDSSPILWASKKIQVTWKQYESGSIKMWHPILSIQTSSKKQNNPILFEATNKQSVYWGAPLRIVWLVHRKELLIRLVEVTRLGSPAYAACLRIGIDNDNLQLLESVEPGRDRYCPAWSNPLFEATEQN